MILSIEILKTLITNGRLDYRKQNIIGHCPWCGGDEFGVSIKDNHRFGCFRLKACGERGNIFKLLKKVNRLDLLRNGDNITVTSYLQDVLKDNSNAAIPLEEIKPPIGFRRIFSHPYLIKRGFQESDFVSCQIGMTKLDSDLRDRVIFLINQKGKLVATVARTIYEKEKIKQIEQNTGRRYPRYINSKTDFEQILYGIDECTVNTDTAILVEGLMGKRNIDEKLELHEQEGIKCLCTFGAKISDTQLLLLHESGIENIILMFDPDVVNYIKKYSNRLADEFNNVKVALIQQQDKDPADLIKEEVFGLFENLQGVLEFSLNQLQILKLE